MFFCFLFFLYLQCFCGFKMKNTAQEPKLGIYDLYSCWVCSKTFILIMYCNTITFGSCIINTILLTRYKQNWPNISPNVLKQTHLLVSSFHKILALRRSWTSHQRVKHLQHINKIWEKCKCVASDRNRKKFKLKWMG